MDTNGYLNEIRALSASGQATEHSYRPALERLFKSIDDDLIVINEPKRLTDVGAPDFVFNRNGVSVGWCEAKDLTKEITKFKTGDYSKEQKARYAKGLPNLIYTNGTDFEFIVKGEVTGFVSIADLIPTLPARPDQFPRLEMLLKDFASQTPISINTAKQLAQMMAGKAVIIKDIMGNALTADKDAGIATELTDQYEGFKTSLIHDITIADFADVYAETIAYGLFAARLHDNSLDTFNRAEALELLPKSNPFLRNLFVYIAGPNLDDRLRRMIDDLCDVFRACDVSALMQDFGKFTARNDPFLHFYETFLAEYNPAKRKARGVWYTPEPVVNFIVRAVDDVLKTEFGLPMGLADTSKISIDWDSGQNDAKGRPVMTKKDVHRVQILDPATGTGTFLAEAIKQIAAQVNNVAPAMWSSYVERDLIPRLHGFELLMASYAMCHMKLDMMLTDMGYKPSASPPRLGVYLTNSLEEGERVEQTLPFARWLSEEAKGANTIKRDTPIMCVIGNPPYSVSSQNTGEWITGLIESYKQDLNEQNVSPLSDDYVKFLRLAQHFIDKNGSGVLGFITNHSYLDGVIHRVMRSSLRTSFDKIFIIDLHGSALREELSSEGLGGENVFDITVGVSIIIAIKTSQNSHPAKVYRHDMWGSRSSKNEELFSTDMRQVCEEIEVSPAPFNLFRQLPKEIDLYANASFSLKSLATLCTAGVKFRKDSLLVKYHFDSTDVETMIEDIRSMDAQQITQKYSFNETSDWRFADKAKLFQPPLAGQIRPVLYRPFDVRYTYYPLERISQIIPRGDARVELTKNIISGPNISLIFNRQHAKEDFSFSWVTDLIGCHGTFYLGNKGQDYIFPLYLYPEEGTLETERRVNFDPKIYAEIRERAGLSENPSPLAGEERDLARDELSRSGEGASAGAENIGAQTRAAPSPSAAIAAPSSPARGEGFDDRPDELRVFDYIYGVLHSPDYRRTYAQFLKIDFPRIPYPASPAVFAHVADKGGQLRRLHLMEAEAIGATPYPFMGSRTDGDDNVVGKPAYAIPPRHGEGDHDVVVGSPLPDGARAEAGDPSVSAKALPPPRTGEELGRVHINSDQYFDGVPLTAWEFHIGGYQPAQKWLKDRKGRALSFDDVMHYQRIIKILCETGRIMKEIILPL